MDPLLFTEFKTGILAPITVGDKKDWAFVPSLLPPPLSINQKLWSRIAEANLKIGRLDGVGSALPSATLLLRPLQRREALTSNSLEGTIVTPKELLLFEAEKNQQSQKGTTQVDDWYEVLNYDAALQRGCKHITEGGNLDRSLLCDLHRILLAGVRGRDKKPGELRESQVYVGVERRFIPVPPGEIAPMLDNWEHYLSTDDGLHPLIRAYVGHYQFEAIHPFNDGNGRLGRLWLSLTLQRALSLSFPWLYMSEFFEKHRKDYIERLFRVSTHGEWADWLDFCLVGTTAQADASIKRCETLRMLKTGYHERVGHMSSRMHRIVDELFLNPFVEVSRIRKLFNVAYQTARNDLQRLVAEGILAQLEDHHPTTFFAREIFWAAYGD